ncbi:hypothetical protein VNO77_07496 [Canavalia gladiata]|uniref:Uncharacterized protein n=1 Tax=Canavalia gladiata TaxID=3824 RepID=A0AAN9M8G2_CANGL
MPLSKEIPPDHKPCNTLSKFPYMFASAAPNQDEECTMTIKVAFVGHFSCETMHTNKVSRAIIHQHARSWVKL